jgi:hypothetical protein
MAVILRLAQADDVMEIMKLCQEMHEEVNKHYSKTWSLDKALAVCTKSMQENMVCVLFDNDENKICGFFAALEGASYWSDDLILYEIGFFISQNYRSLANARMLLTAAKQLAEYKKRVLVFTVDSNYRVEGMRALFEREGFKITGFTASYLEGWEQGE